ncbi:MAG: efflux RND transporter periplasmic adaptor subunit [Candidatus Adiutrix sp.]|jgi:membrane fusion protein (multidrug efflux system)|nr:efflux RND transporter periplasmic adaptor subunit [Candidatus Adiutrix sp.]
MSDASHHHVRFKPSYFALIPVGIIVLALVTILAGRRQPPPFSLPPQTVVLGEVRALTLAESSEFVAQMEADLSVDLKARVSGFLRRQNFSAGDLVEKDQVLFQIEPDQYQALVDMAKAEMISAQAQYDRATLDFTRIRDLFQKNTSTKSDFDTAKAAFEVAEAQILIARARQTQAQLNLDYATIRAPFTGRISDTPYSEGSLLGPESGVLATVVSTDPILVVFGLSSRLVTAAGILGEAPNPDDWRVRLRLGPETYYPQAGRVTYIAPTVDVLTDTVKLKASFNNPEGLLRPGQIITAILESAQPRPRLAVPKEAVLTDAEGQYVLAPLEIPEAGGWTTERRPVALERDETDRDYFIKEGLTAGDRIVVKGLMSGGATLRPGAPVRPAPPEEGEGPKAPGQPAGEGDK